MKPLKIVVKWVYCISDLSYEHAVVKEFVDYDVKRMTVILCVTICVIISQ